MISENQILKENALKDAEEERIRKTELIQQIKMLERSLPALTAQKAVDLTETPGFGLLSEMSIVEVHNMFINKRRYLNSFFFSSKKDWLWLTCVTKKMKKKSDTRF